MKPGSYFIKDKRLLEICWEEKDEEGKGGERKNDTTEVELDHPVTKAVYAECWGMHCV